MLAMTYWRRDMRYFGLISTLLLAACTTEQDPLRPDPLPDPEDQIVKSFRAGLDGHVLIANGQKTIEHNLIKLTAFATGEVTAQSCLDAFWAATEMCWSTDTGCEPNVAFFYANDTPRCGIRIRTWDGSDFERLYAFDLDGNPATAAPELCGNGIVDPGEACDDGNDDNWDGCDSHCFVEPFTGCEALIEQKFADANIAIVAQDQWDGPTSHMMTQSAPALGEVTEQSCAAAAEVAQQTCVELAEQMPFIGSCWGQNEYHDGKCSIRFNVFFNDIAPETGVFTTKLNGMLAFTIE